MQIPLSPVITKSDFLLFCDAPRHLWAKKNGKVDFQPADFDQHLMSQGYVVENMAREYVDTFLLPQLPDAQLLWQTTVIDDVFEARCDVLIFKPATNSYDLYEVKSSTGVDKQNLYDVAYQLSILKSQMIIDHCYLLHLNKEYIFTAELELAKLFIAEDVTAQVTGLLPEVAVLRQEAWKAAQADEPGNLAYCLNPKECLCPELCHPNLPAFSIYDIPRLSKQKKAELLALGILEAKDIPASFGLNPKQRLVAERARTQVEYIDRSGLKNELEKIVYPVYFLDYETCMSAIPLCDGYHPQQQIVFQYSLHRLGASDGELIHSCHISITKNDPSLALLEHLSAEIGDVGTIIVWNKTFEMTMNREMAKLHPVYAVFLEQVNQRIYDLGEIINQGYYLHPGFKGTWSIKQVLPVMVQELSYEGMDIHQGGQASMAWWKIACGQADDFEIEQLTHALETYCQLDTLAMVEIFKRFQEMSRMI